MILKKAIMGMAALGMICQGKIIEGVALGIALFCGEKATCKNSTDCHLISGNMQKYMKFWDGYWESGSPPMELDGTTADTANGLVSCTYSNSPSRSELFNSSALFFSASQNKIYPSFQKYSNWFQTGEPNSTRYECFPPSQYCPFTTTPPKLRN